MDERQVKLGFSYQTDLVLDGFAQKIIVEY